MHLVHFVMVSLTCVPLWDGWIDRPDGSLVRIENCRALEVLNNQDQYHGLSDGLGNGIIWNHVCHDTLNTWNLALEIYARYTLFGTPYKRRAYNHHSHGDRVEVSKLRTVRTTYYKRRTYNHHSHGVRSFEASYCQDFYASRACGVTRTSSIETHRDETETFESRSFAKFPQSHPQKRHRRHSGVYCRYYGERADMYKVPSPNPTWTRLGRLEIFDI